LKSDADLTTTPAFFSNTTNQLSSVPQIRVIFLRHCALYKFTYLLKN